MAAAVTWRRSRMEGVSFYVISRLLMNGARFKEAMRYVSQPSQWEFTVLLCPQSPNTEQILQPWLAFCRGLKKRYEMLTVALATPASNR
jgi:intergrase/recombinase